jgi:hypothetical protein
VSGPEEKQFPPYQGVPLEKPFAKLRSDYIVIRFVSFLHLGF